MDKWCPLHTFDAHYAVSRKLGSEDIMLIMSQEAVVIGGKSLGYQGVRPDTPVRWQT